MSTKRFESPIPVTILTGFLGSGKTTLVNRILSADHGLRIAVMVNDFGAVNIDAQLIVDVTDDTVNLANGCICCTIRGDLVGALLELVGREDPPEYILIEASGVSDPLEVAMVFRMPELQNLIAVDSVIAMIDAEQTPQLEGENAVLALLQVGSADIIIINKIDLVDEAQRVHVIDWAKRIQPKARILETSHAAVPLSLIIGVGSFDPLEKARDAQAVHVHAADGTDDHSHSHDMVFDTWTYETDSPLSLKALRKIVEKLPEGIYRAKGIVYLADDLDRQGVLQVVGKRANLTQSAPWDDVPPHTQIVVIGTHGCVDGDGLTTLFDTCLATNAPSADLKRLTDNVLEWLRESVLR